MKTISLACYNRPDYLKRTLDSLQSIDWTGWTLYLYPEHNSPQAVLDLCNGVDWIDKRVLVGDTKLGCCKNTYRSISHTFAAGSDFNIYMEDDIECAKGLRKLAEWYYDYNDVEHTMLCLETYNICGDTACNVLARGKNFNAHGMMCSRSQFYKHLDKQWLDGSLSVGPGKGWDWNVCGYLKKQDTPHTLFAMHAYCHHFGEKGTYCTPEAYNKYGWGKVRLCASDDEQFVIRK